jgi:aspartyl-tRNA(Asn)/glutamyl-tRNA(Gln) amidotransferase subunit C
MPITREEAEHLARLARLSLSGDELDRLVPQLEVILGAVARVSEVAAADVPPTTHAVPMTNVFRPDRVCPSLPVDEVLAAAPVAEGGRFVVPRILDPDE